MDVMKNHKGFGNGQMVNFVGYFVDSKEVVLLPKGDYPSKCIKMGVHK
jgi:hypothetical protein